MAHVEVQLPWLLGPMVGGQRQFTLSAATLLEAFDELKRNHRAAALHLFDESGGLRRHVLCLLNGTNSRWIEEPHVPLHDGDTLTFMQAVSGG